MNSIDCTTPIVDNTLLVDFYGYLAQLIDGDIDEGEISDLIDLNIELSAEYA